MLHFLKGKSEPKLTPLKGKTAFFPSERTYDYQMEVRLLFMDLFLLHM
jgi:hypothetical protein